MENKPMIIVLILIVLIIMSAFFSSTETAYSSYNRIRIKNKANSGDKRAQLVLKLSDNYNKLLSTILIGNNIVNIAAASLATVIFVQYFGNAGISISTTVMTVLVLVFGEITPKSLAKDSPEKFCMSAAPLLNLIIIILNPLNFIFAQWKRLLNKFSKTEDSPGITEDELIMIVEEAEHDGGINSQERELILSAIEFYDLDVADILTPRIDVVAIEQNENIPDIAETFYETGYSRLPVYKKSIDNIIGVINQKDFHHLVVCNKQPLSSAIKPVIMTSSTMKISILLKKLQLSKTHLAVIIDEYGGTMGIVTLEDIIEELVGEIWDEHDEILSEFTKLSDNSYKVSGSTSLNRFFEKFHIQNKIINAVSVSGWVVWELARIPEEGDSFSIDGLDITVSKMEQRRVQEIIVSINEE